MLAQASWAWVGAMESVTTSDFSADFATRASARPKRPRSVESVVPTTIGTILAAGLYAWQHDWRLSLVVVLAVVANLFVAALGGILAPIVLDRFGRDPAVSSSVVVTFMTDFFGFLALLGIAALILL